MRRKKKVALILDNDGTLVDSESHAVEVCTRLVNERLQNAGIDVQFTVATYPHGRSTRAVFEEVCASFGITPSTVELEQLYSDEEEEILIKLQRSCQPSGGVKKMLKRLPFNTLVSVASSSTHKRIDMCLNAAGLRDFIPRSLTFSAIDSLPSPTPKPEPDIYIHAKEKLRSLGASSFLAVEDSPAGVSAAVAAKIQVVGYVGTVPYAQRAARRESLARAGASHVISRWRDLSRILITHWQQ